MTAKLCPRVYEASDINAYKYQIALYSSNKKHEVMARPAAGLIEFTLAAKATNSADK